MQGNKLIIKQLSVVLKDSLTIINQLFVHAKMLKHQGVDSLGSAEYKASIKAMKISDDIIERILYMDGLPNLQALGRLQVGENVKEMLECDLSAFTEQRKNVLTAIDICETEADYVTSNLLRCILTWQEELIDWQEEQLGLIDDLNIELYIQSQL
jgi:bacterioferritin